MTFGPGSDLSKGLGQGFTKLGDALGITKGGKVPAPAPQVAAAPPPSPYGDLGSAVSAFGSHGSATAQSVTERLMRDYGLTREQAIGATGWMGYESGDFKVMQERGRSGVNSGWGYAQWTGPRRQAFMDYAQKNGLDPSSDEANYGFLRHELDGEKRGVIPALKQTGTIEDANRVWGEKFEGMREGGPGVPAFQNHLDRAMLYDQQLPQNFNPSPALAQIQQSLTKGASGLTQGFGAVTTDLTQGAGGISTALGDLTKSLMSGGGGGGGGGFGGLFGGMGGGGLGDFESFATGGWINGKGTGTSDSNIAAVSDGEFIVNANAAGKYAGLLESINSGKTPTLGAGHVANIANVRGGHTVNVHVEAGKEYRQLAHKIGQHVDAALAKHAPRDAMRYSPSQKGAMAGGFLGKASHKNG